MHSCFFRDWQRKTLIAFPNKKDTQRDLIYVYVYIIYTVYIYIYMFYCKSFHISFQTVDIRSYFYYTKSLPANPHQYHLPQVSSCNPPCLENVCACILEVFQPKSFETKNLLRGHLLRCAGGQRESLFFRGKVCWAKRTAWDKGLCRVLGDDDHRSGQILIFHRPRFPFGVR